MKKIAIVSCYFQHNYGSMIQAYATQMALDKLGCENETIDISGFRSEIKKKKLLYFIKASLTSDFFFAKLGRIRNTIKMNISNGDYSENMNKRNDAFKSFEEKYFRLSPSYSSIKDLSKKSEERYSAVLVGSDQLWLPGNIAADYYTLNWVSESINTIAYATSFGQALLPKDIMGRAAKFLNKIRHISVREESGQRLIKDIVDRNVPVVCDPTLLFSGDEWLSIQRNDPIVDGDYIFCYFLGNNILHRKFAKKLSEKTGYKIVILPHIDEYVKADQEIGDEFLYEVGPENFLNLIRNASYVCTDSFHCTVFSIQYERKFFTFQRFSNKSIHSTNSRLDTLFNLTGIKGRLISGEERIEDCINNDIDYTNVRVRLADERAKSFEFLRNAIEES